MGEDNWKHRSKGMKCGTCMWFVEKVPARIDEEGMAKMSPARVSSYLDYSKNRRATGRCRRHAPTLGGWPVMFVSDWCGDHKLDEEKA